MAAQAHGSSLHFLFKRSLLGRLDRLGLRGDRSPRELEPQRPHPLPGILRGRESPLSGGDGGLAGEVFARSRILEALIDDRTGPVHSHAHDDVEMAANSFAGAVRDGRQFLVHDVGGFTTAIERRAR